MYYEKKSMYHIKQHYCISLHCIAFHCIILHCIALHCIALHCIALHYIALHCIALHCIALHCIALYCIVLHCIALHCFTQERGAIVSAYSTLQKPLPVMWVQSPLGEDFQRNIMFFPSQRWHVVSK